MNVPQKKKWGNRTKSRNNIGGCLTHALIRVEGSQKLVCDGFETVPSKNRFTLIREISFPPSDVGVGIKAVIRELRKLSFSIPKCFYSRHHKRILHLAICFGGGCDSCLFEMPIALLDELTRLKMKVEIFVLVE